MRFNRLLFWCVILLVPLILFSVGLELHLLSDSHKITYLLTILLRLLCIDLLLSLARYSTKHRSGTGLLEYVAIAVSNPHYYMLTAFLKVLIMGTLLLWAGLMNSWILAVMLVLIPLNILRQRMLYKELVDKSKDLQQRFGGAQGFIAAARGDCLDKESVFDVATLSNFILLNKFVQPRSKFLQLVNLIAKTLVVVLALYDFTVQGSNLGDLAAYCLLLTMFFSFLCKIVEETFTKQELINSITYICEAEERLTRVGESTG